MLVEGLEVIEVRLDSHLSYLSQKSAEMAQRKEKKSQPAGLEKEQRTLV